jgi:hypothetical protein
MQVLFMVGGFVVVCLVIAARSPDNHHLALFLAAGVLGGMPWLFSADLPPRHESCFAAPTVAASDRPSADQPDHATNQCPSLFCRYPEFYASEVAEPHPILYRRVRASRIGRGLP